MQPQTFISDETGAVTVDWVALVAGILVLGIGIIPAIYEEVRSLTPVQKDQLGTVSAFTKIS
jgi:hypothetical protein